MYNLCTILSLALLAMVAFHEAARIIANSMWCATKLFRGVQRKLSLQARRNARETGLDREEGQGNVAKESNQWKSLPPRSFAWKSVSRAAFFLNHKRSAGLLLYFGASTSDWSIATPPRRTRGTPLTLRDPSPSSVPTTPPGENGVRDCFKLSSLTL